MEKTEFEIAASMLRGKLVDIARFYLSDEDEAEDIVQEAMLKLWLVRDRIDREKNISPMGMTVTRIFASTACGDSRPIRTKA